VERLRVRFDYELSAPSPRQTTGTATLLGELASSSGWQRRLELQPPRRFTGDRARMTGTLALAPLESLLARIETATGGDAIPSYTLTLVARVRVHGRVAGSPLETGFAPRLSFALDRFQLRPLLAGASAQGGSAPLAGQSANPFRSSPSGATPTASSTTAFSTSTSSPAPTPRKRRLSPQRPRPRRRTGAGAKQGRSGWSTPGRRGAGAKQSGSVWLTLGRTGSGRKR